MNQCLLVNVSCGTEYRSFIKATSDALELDKVHTSSFRHLKHVCKILCMQKQAQTNVCVALQVNHSRSLNSRPLEPWLLLHADGAVELAHCTCMAGLGEACSHIAAVLFYLEALVKLREGKSCTDLANSWRPAYVKNVACCPIAKMDFSSATAKRQRFDGVGAEAAGKLRKNISKPTKEELSKFFAQLHASGARSSILALTQEYAHNYIPTVAKYPAALLGSLYKDDKPASWEEVMTECNNIASRLIVDPEVSKSFIVKHPAYKQSRDMQTGMGP